MFDCTNWMGMGKSQYPHSPIWHLFAKYKIGIRIHLSQSMLKHYPTRRIGMSLRVTKCHRAAIFDGAYLRTRAKYGCDSSSYRTVLRRPTITSLSFSRSHSILILQRHLGRCWNLQCWPVQSCQLPNLSHLSLWDRTVCSISSGWPGKPYPQPRLVPFSARTFSGTLNQNVPKGH